MLRIFFPSKKENRVEQLLNKLLLKENRWILARLPMWIYESSQYAKIMEEKSGSRTKAAYRVLYIMNHLCPSLHHFHKLWRTPSRNFAPKTGM